MNTITIKNWMDDYGQIIETYDQSRVTQKQLLSQQERSHSGIN